nr:unnamed protein product [Digitaria exilis]
MMMNGFLCLVVEDTVGNTSTGVVKQEEGTGNILSPLFSGTKPKKRLTSKLWDNFIPTFMDGRVAQAKCMHCHQVFNCHTTCGITDLWNHQAKCSPGTHKRPMLHKPTSLPSTQQNREVVGSDPKQKKLPLLLSSHKKGSGTEDVMPELDPAFPDNHINTNRMNREVNQNGHHEALATDEQNNLTLPVISTDKNKKNQGVDHNISPEELIRILAMHGHATRMVEQEDFGKLVAHLNPVVKVPSHYDMMMVSNVKASLQKRNKAATNKSLLVARYATYLLDEVIQVGLDELDGVMERLTRCMEDVDENGNNGINEQGDSTNSVPSTLLSGTKLNKRFRSKVWDDFIPAFVDGKVAWAECMMCHRVLNCSSKIHGTSSLLKHQVNCTSWTQKRAGCDPKQKKLTFLPSSQNKCSGTADAIPEQEELVLPNTCTETKRKNREVDQNGSCKKLAAPEQHVASPLSDNRKSHRETLSPDQKPVHTIQKNEVDHNLYAEELIGILAIHGQSPMMMEQSKFRKLVTGLDPIAKMPSPDVLRWSSWRLFDQEKSKLKEKLIALCSRISLSAYMWHYDLVLAFLCLTVHYVDDEWEKQQKIIRFCPLDPSCNSNELSNIISRAIEERGLDGKVFSILLDDAFVDDSVASNVKARLQKWNKFAANRSLFVVRYATHLLDQVMQVGLDKLGKFMEKSVKFSKHMEPTSSVVQYPNRRYAPSGKYWITADKICRTLGRFHIDMDSMHTYTDPTDLYDKLWDVKNRIRDEPDFYSGCSSAYKDEGFSVVLQEMQQKFKERSFRLARPEQAVAEAHSRRCCRRRERFFPVPPFPPLLKPGSVSSALCPQPPSHGLTDSPRSLTVPLPISRLGSARRRLAEGGRAVTGGGVLELRRGEEPRRASGARAATHTGRRHGGTPARHQGRRPGSLRLTAANRPAGRPAAAARTREQALRLRPASPLACTTTAGTRKQARRQELPPGRTSPWTKAARSQMEDMDENANKGINEHGENTDSNPSPLYSGIKSTTRLRSQVWDDFMPSFVDGKLARAECKHCHKVLKCIGTNGTGSLLRHQANCSTITQKRPRQHEHASLSDPKQKKLSFLPSGQKKHLGIIDASLSRRLPCLTPMTPIW